MRLLKAAPLILFFLFSPSVQGQSGSGTHGGSDIEIQFGQLGTLFCSWLSDEQVAELFNEVSKTSFCKAVRDTKVRERSSIILDHRNVIAINIPAAKEIWINRELWISPQLSKSIKLSVSVHEYLGILELELDQYFLSNRIIELLALRPDLYRQLQILFDQG